MPHEELKADGYDGGYSRLTDFIRAWREGAGLALNTTAFVPLALALLDRLLDHVETVLIEGKSYRGQAHAEA